METTALRRKDTTKGPPLRVLSLDGGGVRGYSMLILLQELMYRTYVECEGKAPRRDQIPKPCDHFDLIAGTGTGGLIALMLGRLRLDIETCKDVYVRMTRRVFETDKTFGGIPYRSTLFKASKLEEAIRQCVREHTVFESEGNDGAPHAGSAYTVSPVASSPRTSGTGIQRRLSRSSVSTTGTSPTSPISPRHSAMINGSIWGNPNALLYDNREYRTKTAVTAVYKGTPKDGNSIFLRSYDSRKEPPPEFNCKIWEAGRATSATGLAFKPIQIGQHFFLDEGAGTYNPSPEVLDEAAVNEWPGREIGVFVSIGTGKRPPGTNHLQHEWWEDFFAGTLGVFAEARRSLISKIEGCEKIHQYMLSEHLAKRNVPRENYIRLNVEVGVGEFGMNEWNRLAEISTNTRMYLTKNEVQKMNLEAAVRLAKIHRMHKRLQAHTTATAESSSDEAELLQQQQQRQYRPVPPIPPPRLPERPSTAPHQPPSHASPPPPPSDVVELPAVELPGEPISPQHFPVPPTAQPPINRVSSQDKYTIISSDAYPQALNIPRRDSQTIIQPGRASLDQISTSPNVSADTFNGPNVPPPVPPKTPIPYPDDGRRNQVTPMPIPPRSASRPVSNGYVYKSNPKLPYPDDGPPPVVNRQRKPTYTPR